MKNHTDFMMQQSFRASNRMRSHQERLCLRQNVELVKKGFSTVFTILFPALAIFFIILAYMFVFFVTVSMLLRTY